MRHIISKESPFRHMPKDMPRRQILYFDALRCSAEMAGLAFERLHDLLVLLSREGEDQPSDKAIRALADAYSVIDSAHRFRELLRVTPNLKHNTAFSLFMKQTQDIKHLRNIVQHLHREVDRIAQEHLPALGVLTWLGPSAAPGGPPTAFILKAGTNHQGQQIHGPMADHLLSFPPGEIGEVCLATAGRKVNLSKLVDHLRTIITSLELPLHKAAADKERFGSDDIVISIGTQITVRP